MEGIEQKITQLDLIENHLKQNGSITSWDAIERYGVTRLSAIIYILRHTKGYNIESSTKTAKNRYGEPTHFSVYSLVKE